jgi:hypothetical protein
MLERICAARAAGQTWIQIEYESAHWKEWDEVPLQVKKLFAAPQLETGNSKLETAVERGDAGLETGNSKLETAPAYRLPHSTLQRWYDLRRGFTDLAAAVKNALGETVFKLMLADGDPQVQIAALTSLARLLLQLDRNQIARERLQIERRRVRLLARKLELEKARAGLKRKGRRKGATGRALTLEDINWLRERTFGLPPIARPEPSHPAQPTADLPDAHEPPPPSDDGGVAAEPELPSPYPANLDQTAPAGEPGFSATAQRLVEDSVALPRQHRQSGRSHSPWSKPTGNGGRETGNDLQARLIPPYPASHHRTRLRRRDPHPALRHRVEKPAQQREHFDVSSGLRFCGSALGVFSRRSCFPGPARASPMPNHPAL